MAEKKIQENPITEELPTEPPTNPNMQAKPVDKTAPQMDKSAPQMDKTAPQMDKTAPQMDKSVPQVDKAAPHPVPVATAPQISVPVFTKTPPNDLYRRLLPAVLFLLTFVTVMTILLIYMDTVALGAQQFRVNMSRDYELARIGQASAPLVAYVRQLHLSPRAPPRPANAAPPPATEKNVVLDRLLGELYNGTFIEYQPRGGPEPTTTYLELSRGWAGVVVRAAARDYLALRGAARALHACLSPTDHPREVSYPEPDNPSTIAFTSRVLCLPLYTILLAAESRTADYVLLAGDAALPALKNVPFHLVHLQVIEIRMTDAALRNKTTSFLQTHNYTVAATFPDGIMYYLNE